jgi:Holliday junction resolvasome RuvABC endonuclease subunit
MVAATLQELLIVEVTPQAAKKALTDKGNASKEEMQARASY